MPVLTLLEFLKKYADETDLLAAVVREEAEGAYPNGTRVTKTERAPSDAHGPGDEGTVLGSIGPSEFEGHENGYGYFVEWDDLPGVPVFTASWRLRRVDEDDDEEK
jgi:hypothetical protein